MPMSEYLRELRRKVGHDYLMLQSVTVMLFDPADRLLLVRDAATGLWTTVGGIIDPDETPADAAVRECWEETGLHVAPIRLLGVFGGPQFVVTYGNGDVASFTSTMFEVRRISGEPRPDGVETTAVGSFSQEEAAALETSERTRILLTHAFARDSRPYFAPPRWVPPEA